MRRAGLIGVALAGALLPVAAGALAGEPLGDERQLAYETASQENQVAVAASPDHYAAVWIDDTGPQTEVHARVFTTDGVARTDDIRVDALDSEFHDSNPDVAFGSDGGFVVVWESLENGDDRVRAQRFDAAGTRLNGGEIAHLEAGDQELPAIAAAPDGGFVVAWNANDATTRARRLDAVGNPMNVAVEVLAFDGNGPAVAAQSGGRFVVAETRFTAGQDRDVVARRFDADGSALGDLVELAPADAVDQDLPRLAVGPADSIVAAWTDDPYGIGARWRRFHANLTPATGVLDAGEGEKGQLSDGLGVAADGSVVVALTTENGASYRRFGPDDAPLTPETEAHTATEGIMAETRVAVQPDGDFLVAWEIEVDSFVTDVRGRFFRVAEEEPPPTTTTTTTTTPATTTPAPAGPNPLPPAPTPAPTPAPRASRFADHVTLPRASRCVRGRRLVVRVKNVRRLTARANRRRVAARRAPLPRKLTLRRLPRGRYTLKVTVITSDGRSLSGSRRYRGCR